MIALAVTFSVAVCGGLIGLVLGALRLPPLIALIGDARDAAGTNIALSGATAIAGAFRHVRAERIHRRAFRLLVVPGIVGGFIGGYGAEYVWRSPRLGRRLVIRDRASRRRGRARARLAAPARADRWSVVALRVPAALIGADLGARLSGRVSDRSLRRAIAATLAVLAVALALQVLR